MKLPYLRTRVYVNKAGQTWVGYYFEPPRGSGGDAGVKPKPVPLGDEVVAKGAKHSNVPPPHVLAKYSEVTGTKVQPRPLEGTVAGVYSRWLQWAQAEVKAGRLAARTLKDYEEHWKELGPVFGPGRMDSLDQPVLLAYFDKRSSKDRAKREVNFLGMLCGWAKPRRYMAAPNPVDRHLRLQMRVQRRQKKIVPPEVYRIYWECADQLVRDTIDLAYMLSTRPAEALRVPMPAPGDTEITKYLPKTAKRGQQAVRFPMTPELQALVDRRRALRPNSLYVLFDDDGSQLRAGGTIRSRMYKARDAARLVCKELGIDWVDVTLQVIRPTAITEADVQHGRTGARKAAGHRTEKQTADYIRPEVEVADSVALPQVTDQLLTRIAQARKAD